MSRLTPDEVLQTIALHGEMTRGMLADKLTSNKQTVRHHLRDLLQRGAIIITRQTETHASLQNWYGVPDPNACWRDQIDCLQTRLWKVAEFELREVLDQWGAWTHHRMPSALLENVDSPIAELPLQYRAALAAAHKAVNAWRGSKYDYDGSYRHAIHRLMPVQKSKLRSTAPLGDRCQLSEKEMEAACCCSTRT